MVVLSVAPDYLSGHFSDVSTGGNDVACWCATMGPIWRGADRQEVVLNQFVPPDREFLRHPNRMQGQYQTKSPIDGVERLYAWHRLHNYPWL